MKKAFCILTIVITTQALLAQEIQNQVIGSGGDMNLIGNAMISWTIGECVTESYCNTNCLITQGFHQSYFKIFGIPEDHHQPLNVKVYPNPTSGLLNIDLTLLAPNRSYQVILSNAEGKVLLRQEIPSDDTFQLRLHQFQDGLMILKVMDISGSSQSSFKIIKINH